MSDTTNPTTSREQALEKALRKLTKWCENDQREFPSGEGEESYIEAWETARAALALPVETTDAEAVELFHEPDCPATDGFSCRCNGIDLAGLRREHAGEVARLREALERAFVALGQAGGNSVQLGNVAIREAWLSARAALAVRP